MWFNLITDAVYASVKFTGSHFFAAIITPCWGQNRSGGPNVPEFPIHGAQEILNPMLEATYSFLKSFYEEIVQVFPDEYVHLGMDEAYKACWYVLK